MRRKCYSLAFLWSTCKSINIVNVLSGQGGGVPWVQIMENECLVVREGDGDHFAEKFVKNYCS